MRRSTSSSRVCSVMAKSPPKDWYWPLGGINYASEVHDFFPEEAELLGSITILWNRQEAALRRLFAELIAPRATRRDYALAIWDRQPTHQARRDMLALAFDAAKLTKRQKGILKWIVDRTKTLADRRNDLMHAEYVVHGRTDALHARVKAPKSQKPPKHQRAAVSDLIVVERELEHLLQATEAALFEFMPARKRRDLKALGNELAAFRRCQQNQQND